MKIWIHIDGMQQGPFDQADLPVDRMTAETPVWYEGLDYWMPAGRAPLTASMFAGGQQFSQAYQPREQAGAYAAAATARQEGDVKCPPTYLVWSVLLTVLCCNPVGIVGIVTGSMVSSRFRNYNYEGARKASELTEWWLMITIVTSLILAPLTMLSSF